LRLFWEIHGDTHHQAHRGHLQNFRNGIGIQRMFLQRIPIHTPTVTHDGCSPQSLSVGRECERLSFFIFHTNVKGNVSNGRLDYLLKSAEAP
jgi:hypothetical protein